MTQQHYQHQQPFTGSGRYCTSAFSCISVILLLLYSLNVAFIQENLPSSRDLAELKNEFSSVKVRQVVISNTDNPLLSETSKTERKKEADFIDTTSTEWNASISSITTSTDKLISETKKTELNEDNITESKVSASSYTENNDTRPVLTSNDTHALLTDDSTQRQWYILKRSLEEYDTQWYRIVKSKYEKRDKSHLDILSAIGPEAVLEMEDKRGREYKVLNKYYRIWSNEKPFSGEPFFDWLDYGKGRKLELHEGYREILNRRQYKKLNNTELEDTIVDFKLINSDNNNNNEQQAIQLVWSSTQIPVEEGQWSTVWKLDKTFYIIKDGKFDAPDQLFDYWKVGHCSLTHGIPVLYAGEIVIGKNGIIQETNPQSGHYRPKLDHTKQFYKWLRNDKNLGNTARSAIDWKPLPPHMYHKTHTDVTEEEWVAIFEE